MSDHPDTPAAHKRADDAPPDSRGYWDENLDTGNIGREEEAVDWTTEQAFFLAAPEVRWAIDQLFQRGANEDATAPLRIVDIGTGMGVAAAEFARRGAQVVAVDPAPKRLERAREVAAGIGVADRWEPCEGTAESLPLPDASVDRVFTRSVLIHTDLMAAVAEMRRVLRPGGAAVLVEPMAHNPLVNLYRATLAPKEWQGITRYFTEERVAMVRDGGWASFGERRFHLFGFGAYAFQFALRSPMGMRATMAIASPLDRLLMATIPPTRRFAWFSVMVCRRGED